MTDEKFLRRAEKLFELLASKEEIPIPDRVICKLMGWPRWVLPRVLTVLRNEVLADSGYALLHYEHKVVLTSNQRLFLDIYMRDLRFLHTRTRGVVGNFSGIARSNPDLSQTAKVALLVSIGTRELLRTTECSVEDVMKRFYAAL